jgi:hypothetical protein
MATGNFQVASSSGKLTIYNGDATVGQGVADEYAGIDLTTQGAAISATNIVASATSGGSYRINFIAHVTQAATTSMTLGGALGFQAVYTNSQDSVVVTTGTALNQCGGPLTTNTTQTTYCGTLFINAKISTAIQYVFGYTSSGATPMQYELHIKLERM